MDAKFFNSLTEGEFGNGLLLRQHLVEGDFWPRPAGCHTVYKGQDGTFDYEAIQAVMELADSQVTINHQDLPADTIWHYVRRQVSGCGLESADSPPCIVRIASDGEAILAAPNPPVDLTATAITGGKVELRWRYNVTGQAVAPDGFNIYIDSGSGFNFTSPDDQTTAPSILARLSSELPVWTTSALTHGTRYRFCVRAYKTGGGESQNTNYASAIADNQGPAAITGLRASWQEVT